MLDVLFDELDESVDGHNWPVNSECLTRRTTSILPLEEMLTTVELRDFIVWGFLCST